MGELRPADGRPGDGSAVEARVRSEARSTTRSACGIEATRLLAGRDVADPVKVLVVTTFELLDEYVYEALRAGAGGFPLKDSPSAESVNAVRTIARGEALLAPAVNRGLIGRFGERTRPGVPAPPGERGRA